MIFNDGALFAHHAILPKSLITSDEGAANHNRICSAHNKAGINLFVYGKQALPAKHNEGSYLEGPVKYPARQTLEASQAIARLHQLDPDKVIFARQNPRAIDQGVFHNDVIAVVNESVVLIHEEAFLQQADVLKELQVKADFPVQILTVSSQQMSVADAVSTYFFNSQLITLPNDAGKKCMVLIAPIECEHHQATKEVMAELFADDANPIAKAYFLDLKQSMRNGGGPACLRLRVPLN